MIVFKKNLVFIFFWSGNEIIFHYWIFLLRQINFLNIVAEINDVSSLVSKGKAKLIRS